VGEDSWAGRARRGERVAALWSRHTFDCIQIFKTTIGVDTTDTTAPANAPAYHNISQALRQAEVSAQSGVAPSCGGGLGARAFGVAKRGEVAPPRPPPPPLRARRGTAQHVPLPARAK
jgi:hypothetical protein